MRLLTWSALLLLLTACASAPAPRSRPRPLAFASTPTSGPRIRLVSAPMEPAPERSRIGKKESDLRYYKLSNDMRILDRWTFGDPMDGDGQELWHGHLTEGLPISVREPLRIGLYAPGRPLDFSTTAFSVPIIHGKFKELLEQLGLSSQIQVFPITVEGQAEPYYLLNLLRVVRCIDDARCEEVAYRTAEDGYEDGIGEYRNVVGMRIDPSKVGDAEIFRPWGWQTNIIVSERVKRAMEESGMTGARFTEV